MSVPIRIDDTTYNKAKIAAEAEFRSIPGQIQYWATLGRCALDNPDLPIEFIKDILAAKDADPSTLEPFDFNE